MSANRENLRMECDLATPNVAMYSARTVTELLDTIDLLRGALADIATSQDMNLECVRKKAKRIYEETA